MHTKSKKNMVTLEDLEKIDTNFFTPQDVAPYLGCTSYTLNKQLQAGIQFPFPAYMIGTNVKIPKHSFINYHKTHAFENSHTEDKIIDLLTRILKSLQTYKPRKAKEKTADDNTNIVNG